MYLCKVKWQKSQEEARVFVSRVVAENVDQCLTKVREKYGVDAVILSVVQGKKIHIV